MNEWKKEEAPGVDLEVVVWLRNSAFGKSTFKLFSVMSQVESFRTTLVRSQITASRTIGAQTSLRKFRHLRLSFRKLPRDRLASISLLSCNKSQTMQFVVSCCLWLIFAPTSSDSNYDSNDFRFEVCDGSNALRCRISSVKNQNLETFGRI